jgi:hypothetical protein
MLNMQDKMLIHRKKLGDLYILTVAFQDENLPICFAMEYLDIAIKSLSELEFCFR